MKEGTLNSSILRANCINKVYVSIGSNLEDPLNKIHLSIQMLQNESYFQQIRVSKIYLSSPVSPISQPDFFNAVCSFYTSDDIFDVFSKLEKMERDLGKLPKPKEAPRPIDIDLLFFGQYRVNSKRIKVPHPKWMERVFVLLPLLDLTHTVEIEDRHYCIDTLLKKCQKVHNDWVIPIEDYPKT